MCRDGCQGPEGLIARAKKVARVGKRSPGVGYAWFPRRQQGLQKKNQWEAAPGSVTFPKKPTEKKGRKNQK